MSAQLTIGDIDLDVINRDDILSNLPHVVAARKTKDGVLVKHNTGIYPIDLPADSKTRLCLFDYKSEEIKNYPKIDFIHYSAINVFLSNKHITHLLNIEPNWSLLLNKEFVEELTQIHNHYDLLSKMNVDSVDKLAMFLGIIRPGKEYLRYKNWNFIEKNVWKDENNGYSFKKSHAYGYALTIVALMNLKSGE